MPDSKNTMHHHSLAITGHNRIASGHSSSTWIQEGEESLYRSPDYQTSLESIGNLVQEKKFKTDSQHGCYGDHLGFLIGTILTSFDLQGPPILPIILSQLAFPFKRRS